MTNSVVTYLGQHTLLAILGEEQPPALGPFVQGSTRPSWTVTVRHRDNTSLNCSSATFSGVLWDQQTSNRVTLGGTFTGSSTGFTYDPVAADTATPGVYEVEVKITISTQPYYVTARLVVTPRKAA